MKNKILFWPVIQKLQSPVNAFLAPLGNEQAPEYGHVHKGGRCQVCDLLLVGWDSGRSQQTVTNA